MECQVTRCFEVLLEGGAQPNIKVSKLYSMHELKTARCTSIGHHPAIKTEQH